jgi:hypothetical protein
LASPHPKEEGDLGHGQSKDIETIRESLSADQARMLMCDFHQTSILCFNRYIFHFLKTVENSVEAAEEE